MMGRYGRTCSYRPICDITRPFWELRRQPLGGGAVSWPRPRSYLWPWGDGKSSCDDHESKKPQVHQCSVTGFQSVSTLWPCSKHRVHSSSIHDTHKYPPLIYLLSHSLILQNCENKSTVKKFVNIALIGSFTKNILNSEFKVPMKFQKCKNRENECP